MTCSAGSPLLPSGPRRAFGALSTRLSGQKVQGRQQEGQEEMSKQGSLLGIYAPYWPLKWP